MSRSPFLRTFAERGLCQQREFVSYGNRTRHQVFIKTSKSGGEDGRVGCDEDGRVGCDEDVRVSRSRCCRASKLQASHDGRHL